MIKHITFHNTKGEEISGVLKQKNANAPLLIVCHGYNSSINHPGLEAITNKLYDMGDSTFAFNFSKAAQGANILQQVADLNDILAYFKDHKKKVLLGGSFGALSSTIVAGQSPKVAGLITVNGFFGSKHLGRDNLKTYLMFKLLGLFKPFYKTIWKFLQTDLRPEKITVATLVMHAKQDKEVFIMQSETFFKNLAKPKEFYLLEIADHNLTREEYRQEVAEVIHNWLKNI